MALFQPTNVIPSTLSGEGNGTIDATEALTVSWQINGNSPMTAYRIKIMQNDASSTLLLDTGKTTLNKPSSGADRLGNPIPFTAMITAAQMTAAGIVNGYANGYKMTIQQWWTDNDSIEQTNPNYFITRTTPSVFLQYIPYATDFRQQEHLFEAFYSQAQNDAIAWYRWELEAEENGGYVSIDDTGPIYGGELIPYGEGTLYNGYYGILYAYKGFSIGTSGISGEGVKYRIRCRVQTENGVEASAGWTEFTTQSIIGDPVTLRLCTTKSTDAVKIAMPKNFPVLGEANGPYDYTFFQYQFNHRFGLNLPSGSSVTWGGEGEKSLDISGEPYTIAMKAHITDADAETEFFAGNVNYGWGQVYPLSFSYDQNGFYIKTSGVILWSTDIQPVTGADASIGISAEKVYFVLDDNGQTQSSETDLQRNFWQNYPMDSVTINGPICFIDVWIVKGNMDLATFYNMIVFNNRVPDFTNDTMLILQFDHTLYTGNRSIGAGGVGGPGIDLEMTTDIGIYRKEKDSLIFQLIANVPLNEHTKDTVLYDYSALNGVEYEYFLTYMWDHVYLRARDGIGSITPCFWNYTVLCCDTDNNGDYIVKSEYRFALDVGSGNVGNNNNPSLQQNFTRYPLRQPVSNQYRSGTLTAYIGKAVNGQYVDTVGLMDELYALSSNGQTKFLKTRKGQIFQIETASPVSMNIGDKYAQQPAKISLPWVEVGDASKANILGESANIEGTPTFSVDPETMELTMEYSESSAMGENCFAMEDQDLYLLNPGVYNERDFSLNENMEVVLNTN